MGACDDPACRDIDSDQCVIGTTLRRNKRAYLFHWCWRLGLGKIKASAARRMAGVDIEWDHGDNVASVAGAKEMIQGFQLAVPPKSTNPPSLTSAHIRGAAVDMTITWAGTLLLLDKSKKEHRIPYIAIGLIGTAAPLIEASVAKTTIDGVPGIVFTQCDQ